jgi:hypothetical protein
MGGVADAYIRGGGGVQFNPRRMAAVIVALSIVVLLAVAAELALSASGRNGEVARLQQHGVPVTVTVTKCLGISSGVGMGIEFWQCSGSYSLAGRAYEEIIGGSRTRLAGGQTLAGVADPGHPGVVWSAASLSRQHVSESSYIAPAVLGGLAAAIVAGWAVIRSRRRRRSVRERLGVGLA